MLLPWIYQKLIYPLNAIHIPYMQISLCWHEATMSGYMLHITSLQSTMLPTSLVYIHFTLLAYSPEQICLPHYILTCMSHCPSIIVQISHYYTHKSKNNKLLFLFRMSLLYICWQHICPSNTTYMTHAQITECISLGKVWQYICYKWTHWHQPCDQQHYTLKMLDDYNTYWLHNLSRPLAKTANMQELIA